MHSSARNCDANQTNPARKITTNENRNRVTGQPPTHASASASLIFEWSGLLVITAMRPVPTLSYPRAQIARPGCRPQSFRTRLQSISSRVANSVRREAHAVTAAIRIPGSRQLRRSRRLQDLTEEYAERSDWR